MDKNDNLPALQQDVNPVEDLLIKIEMQEAECLQQILTRFCLLNGLKIDIAKVDYQIFQDRPNYWEYYYIGKASKALGMKHFLMSRELKIIENIPTLEITFNQNLI